jgi:hypothetical protein
MLAKPKRRRDIWQLMECPFNLDEFKSNQHARLKGDIQLCNQR